MFNIYESSLDYEIMNCIDSIELDFVPYQLTHTTYNSNQGNLLKGIVIWLVLAQSGVQSPERVLDCNFSNIFSFLNQFVTL